MRRNRLEPPDARFVAPTGESLLLSKEGEQALWTYGECGVDGALRLIPVAKLLDPTTAEIELLEWRDLKTWPRDGTFHGHGTPPGMPSYAAISHVWDPSEDAARISNEANRPLHIDIGNPTPHTISWLGLVQAATAAKALHCRYLWLDLLCLNQRSRSDKMMQIKNMAKIYSNATAVIVMIGGVVAAQGFDKHSSWITRAWTFQEATLGWPIYVLVEWNLPGSFACFTRLKGGIAAARLNALVEHPTGHGFGVGNLRLKNTEHEFELDLPLRCLGDDPAAIGALKAALLGADSEQGSDSETPIKPSFDRSYKRESETSSEISSSETSSHITTYDDGDVHHGFDQNSNGSSEGGSGALPDDEDPGHGYSYRFGRWRKDSDASSDSLGEANENDTFSDSLSSASFGEAPENYTPSVKGPSGIRSVAVWRNMWLRTSTKPQDLVFSMMHLLGVVIDVEYTRSLRELIFELVAKTSHTPAWMVIGYHLPVYPESGLIPILPSFAPNSSPTYVIDGESHLASEFVCADFSIGRFDIVLKSTSSVEGHLICARILDVKRSTVPTRNTRDSSFYDSELHLSGPDYEVSTKCRFKGRLGSIVVLVGELNTPGELADWEGDGTPFVYLLGKAENGAWQKTGAGTLDEPLLGMLPVLDMLKRRHLRVGGSPGAELVVCDCGTYHYDEKASEKWFEADMNILGEDIGRALVNASSDGNERRVQQLIDMGAHVNGQGGEHGNPLQAACWKGKERIARLLISHGADVHAMGEPHGTALQAACRQNFESVARLLIESGADVNAQAGRDCTALQAAVGQNPTESLNRSTKSIVQLLLDHGANINIQGGRFGNALMAAVGAAEAATPNLEVIRQLIDNGAKVNHTGGIYTDQDGSTYCTTLQVACREGVIGIVRLLLANGADVKAQGGSYHTALQVAAFNGREMICQLLLESGANINTQGGYYGNALQAAIAGNGRGGISGRDRNAKQVVGLLIKNGADINAQGGYYGNALHAATATANKPVMSLLLNKGADETAPGGYYGNALQAEMTRVFRQRDSYP